MRFIISLLFFAITFAHANQYKIAHITNGEIQAYLCVGENRAAQFYQGVRFDPTGVVLSLKANGHVYFGDVYEVHNPKVYDSISGPVEEYLVVGYNDAKVGEDFLKIGVGMLEKISDGKYKFSESFKLKNAGKRTVRVEENLVEYTHTMSDKSGYGYALKKRVYLEKKSLVVEHTLKNIGTKKIDSNVYSHGFYTVDNMTIDSSVVAKFNFKLDCPQAYISKGLAEINGNEIRYLRSAQEKDRVSIDNIECAGTLEENVMEVHFGNANAGVRVRGDKPLLKAVYWSNKKMVCPEPFVKIDLMPNQEMSWKFVYDFFELNQK